MKRSIPITSPRLRKRKSTQLGMNIDYNEPPHSGIVKGTVPPITQNVANLAGRICKIARQAGAVQLKLYKQNREVLNVKMKTDDHGTVSPVTQADLLTAKVITDMLWELDKNIPIVIEEKTMEPFSKRKEYEYYWCVDPLDGTKEFIKANGEFTINIGLIHNGTPVFGVVYVPVKDTIYYGGTLGNYGSWKRTSENSTPERLQVATFSLSDENLTIVMSASHSNQPTKDFVSQFKNPTKISKGSSLKLLMVAEGSAHCYPRLNGTCEWDTAAAHAIVNGAGGRVVVADVMRKVENGKAVLVNGKAVLVKNPDARREVWYNKESSKNPYFVVWGKLRE